MAEVLGTLEEAVLLSIVRLGDDAYGRAIRNAVQGVLGRDIAAGAVHATLERLERSSSSPPTLAAVLLFGPVERDGTTLYCLREFAP